MERRGFLSERFWLLVVLCAGWLSSKAGRSLRALFRRHEELGFTLAALFLLGLCAAAYLSVRFVKEGHARAEGRPSVVAVYPGEVVTGVRQRVTLLGEGTHFGPGSTVEASARGVDVAGVGFASERELWFEIFAHGGAPGEIAVRIRSPLPRGRSEEVALTLGRAREPEPLSLELSSFAGEEHVVTSRDYVVFGYRPRGYAPFHFRVTQLERGAVRTQRTREALEHLGVRLEPGLNPFELRLRDALGREVRERVWVTSERAAEEERFLAFARPAYALAGTYTGKPVQWNLDPAGQVAACDCVLGNGTFACGRRGCAGGIQPPPNDYLTTRGEAVVLADGVLPHSGQFSLSYQVDLYLPGRGLDFVWSRSYHSGVDLTGYLGKNWDFSWGAQFILDNPSTPSSGKFSRGDCRRDLYSDAQLQGYEYVFQTHPQGFYDLKCSVGAGQITQLKRNGFKQVFDSTTGLLKSREDRYGNKITVSYDYSGDLSQVIDTLGRTITFYYGTAGAADGRLVKVRDFSGREVLYEYDDPNGEVLLTKVKYPPVDWTDDTTTPWTEKLSTAREVAYGYDSQDRLTKVIDGRGKERLKNEFDPNGRVTKQYNFSSVYGAPYQSLVYSLVGGQVNVVTHRTRELHTAYWEFDTTSHLSTKIRVEYTPTGGQLTTGVWKITRGCSCTLPTAVEEPDGGYTQWAIDSGGNVTEVREFYDDTAPYMETAGSDLVRKAYYAPLNSTQFGVVTKIVGEKAFTATPDESRYATTVSYDTKGNPRTIQYPNTQGQTGVVEVRTYNSYGQLLKVEGPEGTETAFTYYSTGSEKGYLKERKVKYSATGYLTTTYGWSDFGALTSLTDPRGTLTTYEVDAEFLVKKVTRDDRLGGFRYERRTSYNGNRRRVRVEVQNKEGTALVTANPWWQTELWYDDAGLLETKKREISESGGTVSWQVTQYCYGDDFHLTLLTDPEGRQTRYELDERGLRTKVTRGYGTAEASDTVETYDAEGKLTESRVDFTNPDASSVTWAERRLYDVFDRLEYVYDGKADATGDNLKRTFYDLASEVVKLEEADASGAVLRRTEYEYDERDRRTKLKRGLSGEDVTAFGYDRASRLTLLTDDNSHSTRYQYDLAGRRTKEVLPSLNGQSSGENYVLYEHDLGGDLTRRTSHEVNTLDLSSLDLVWEMEYDELGRRTKRTHKGSDGLTGPNPVETVDTYDSRGLALTLTDADGVQTRQEYDGLGQRRRTTLDYGGGSPIAVEVAYDDSGEVTARTDGEGNVTIYAYDAQGRLVELRHEDDEWQKFTYNELGRVETRVYGTGVALGETTYLTVEYFYDLRGLLRTKEVVWAATPSWEGYDDYKTARETFVYDGVYRLTDADDDDTRVGLAWNALDRVTGETLQVNLRSGGADSWKPAKTTSSVWDEAGRLRTSVSYPVSGKRFESSHDALDRVVGIRLDGTPDQDMVEYWYSGPGQRVVKRERGVDLSGSNTYRATWAYDALLRNTEILHERDTGSVTTLRDVDTTWGDGTAGRIWKRSSYDISDGTGTLVQHDYSYDDFGRVVEDLRGSDDYDYSYSAAQFLEERKKNSSVEISYSEGTPPDGSLQVKSDTEGSTTTDCTYDVCGNLTERSQGGVVAWKYAYDHENRLVYVQKGPDNDVELRYWFRYDALGRRVVEKHAGSSSYERIFYHDGLHVVEETDASLAVERLSLFGVRLDEVLYSGGVVSGSLSGHRWPLEDHLGSVVTVVDDSGVVKTDLDYATAYGETVNGGVESYPYGFTGRRYVELAGLYDYRTRFYDPRLGRFLGRDRIGVWGDPGGLGNGYAYVGNDPVNRLDPYGQDSRVVAFPTPGFSAQIDASGDGPLCGAPPECVTKPLCYAMTMKCNVHVVTTEDGGRDLECSCEPTIVTVAVVFVAVELLTPPPFKIIRWGWRFVRWARRVPAWALP